MRMLNAVFCCLLLFAVGSLYAQTPQKILGIAKEKKTADYYQEQSGLWKKETTKQPKNAHAWHQYYKAQRAYLQLTFPKVWAGNQNEIFGKLQPIINASKKHIGNSFEYYLMESDNTIEDNSIEFLKKAYAIDPSRLEAYEGLMVHYIRTFDDEKATEIAKKMLQENYYSNANLMWNYNTLLTIKKDGLFISNGDMDAFPKWVLQYGMGIRKDVIVANKWVLATKKDYRLKVFKTLGIKDLPKAKETPMGQYVNDLTIHILKNSQKAAYMGCGSNINLFKEAGIADQMYMVGLAFEYSKKEFDNLAVIKKNFEEKYNLDYLNSNFQQHAEDGMVKGMMNLTYLPSLFKLKRHYEETKQSSKVDYYNKIINKIAKESGREKEVLSWYKC
ncbi:MAG: hypothetical protein GY810_27500 [Aureispira sp.]|nr:hypothetical protein [Aureispira sp.]